MKVNVIFDGNNIFHSAFAIFSKWNKRGLRDERDEIEFMQKVGSNFFAALNSLPTADRVVFTIDSKSWRKAIDIPGCDGYKAKREDADGNKGGMDQETASKFFDSMVNFGKRLKDVGIITSRITGAEGDDLIYRWCKRFHDAGENCIIVSSDRDLTQLIKYDHDRKNWIIQWNNKNNNSRNKNTFYVPEGWGDWVSTIDSMSVFDFKLDTTKEQLAKAIRDQNITLETVYPDEVIMNKILSGDDGDNVPPVWTANTYTKAGKPTVVRMSGKKPGVVLDALSAKYGVDRDSYMSKWGDDDWMNDCAGLVLRTTKDVDGADERMRVLESMNINAQLVWLDEEHMPFNLIAEMDMHIDEALHTTHVKRNKWNRHGLFEGTKFEGSITPREYDPFI